MNLDPEESHHIIKLTGMPFAALHEEIAIFFAGCDIKGGKKKYVIIEILVSLLITGNI